jgi:hypothetical protein
MPNVEYSRIDATGLAYLVQYMFNQLKNSPLADNTTYTFAASQTGTSLVVTDDAGNQVALIDGLMTSAERTKLAQNLATTADVSAATAGLATESYVDETVSDAIAELGSVSIEAVQTLPDVAQAVENKIYLVPNGSSGTDQYDEYIKSGNGWEKIGNTAVDLSGFVQASEMTTVSNSDIAAAVDAAYSAAFPGTVQTEPEG